MYKTSFFYLQYGLVVLVEYVCKSGHRIHCRTETIDYEDSKMVWL